MSGANREIHELLADYAGALRDGCIPTFLKSLSHKEAQQIASSPEFREAAEFVRVLNGVAFADKAVTPNVSLFISRVDAKIASRLKGAKTSPRVKRGAQARLTSRTQSGVDRPL